MVDVWKPHVVVAAVTECAGGFLLVEEETPEGIRLNQPAGHLESGESLIEAVRREVLEETGRAFEPTALVAVYRWPARGKRPDFLRFTFCGTVSAPIPGRTLDRGILRAESFPLAVIRDEPNRHRSPLVMRSIDDYLGGMRFPLALLQECAP